MQFINIVVHSVEDMNFRVHLQYEFTKLGLDEYLDVSITFGSSVWLDLLPTTCTVTNAHLKLFAVNTVAPVKWNQSE